MASNERWLLFPSRTQVLVPMAVLTSGQEPPLPWSCAGWASMQKAGAPGAFSLCPGLAEVSGSPLVTGIRCGPPQQCNNEIPHWVEGGNYKEGMRAELEVPVAGTSLPRSTPKMAGHGYSHPVLLSWGLGWGKPHLNVVCATGIGSREFGQERVWLSQRGERFSWHLQDVGTNVHCGPLWVFSSILATVCCGSNSKIKL